jgi:hypothetical protein
MLTKANAIGYAILALVYERLTDEEVVGLNVEPYLNGRESGFAIHFWAGYRKGRFNRKLAFCEMRGTDCIVVYESDSCGFSMQGNGLSEKIYRESVGFAPAEIWKAVDHIVRRLREVKPVPGDDNG